MRAPSRARSKDWPAWRFGPDGQSAIFNEESEVPYGWMKSPGEVFVPPPLPPVLNQEELEAALRAKGIEPLGHWGLAYMKELVDGISSPR